MQVNLTHAEIRSRLKNIIINIRKIRERKSFSQEYMAARLNISQNTYSKLELGNTALTVERFILIAGILDVDVTELLLANKQQ
ncbi:helix-turn-helix domain-containing protein [Mucilaginibacter celer]|uniref:Helix-turn-helix domain-containing protein n=1 Tax=Mucilaginibacter celer TaxID=2305508 RepID=A0A494W6Y3_9SPHI|nr:helix-turn-helix domain-containing protein [Mucilaginibacter celer]